ncbi:replication-relaxation family protein [Lentibacillus amyloliquefaciens]|nr:replication-relaxation family protein [Lentibacillus amyloliquefaciens]
MSSLDELTYATRRQLQVINNLSGDRNAHRILHDMERDRLISSIRKEQKIYYLTNTGKQQIGSSQAELKQSWVTHVLMRNDLYIELGMPGDWRKEVPAKINGEMLLIPDAMFTRNGESHFVEIDNKQKMQTNIEKIKKYKKLSDAVFGQLNHTPTLIWYSLSDIRKEKLKSACERYGVKFKIY